MPPRHRSTITCWGGRHSGLGHSPGHIACARQRARHRPAPVGRRPAPSTREWPHAQQTSEALPSLALPLPGAGAPAGQSCSSHERPLCQERAKTDGLLDLS
eukprot:SM000421S16086  [mRNA]  locus=s421:10375:10790:+ [translate_table: standard]